MHRRTRFLREAIESGLAQAYPNFGVIAVADGATGAADHLLAPYTGRIRLLLQDPAGSSADLHR